MKNNRILQSIILLILILFTAFNFYGNKPNESNTDLILHAQKLDANTISTWFRNNGMFNTSPGFEWPKGSGKYVRHGSGIWIAARVGSDTLVSIADYGSEFLPGYTDGNGIPHGENEPFYRIYKLNLGVNDSGRAHWPNILLGNSNQGAPVYFDNSSNSWKPLDFGHQTLFHRYTDSYPQSHTLNNGSTPPLKADVMQTDFSINIQGGLDLAIISQFTIINKSSSTWNKAFITFWTDDDIGFSSADKVGCDTSLNLGYTYNTINNDTTYGVPPAVGFLMLRGALRFTGNNSDTVFICRNKTRVPLVGYEDLLMSVFNWIANSNHPINGNPASFRESYRYMSGPEKRSTDNSSLRLCNQIHVFW
ncbi:MAG: hypothetical protein L0Y79_04205 [Chlorobi bacterium]|nr:hypothetical protein [Chlorobiota bacterium]MCI0717201.1 hypothetical protein [Chlorobiota bacterium]